MGWEGRETLPFPSDAITTLGNDKAVSLLLLSFAKVSNIEDMLNRQTCQGILLCLHLVTSEWLVKSRLDFVVGGRNCL